MQNSETTAEKMARIAKAEEAKKDASDNASENKTNTPQSLNSVLEAAKKDVSENAKKEGNISEVEEILKSIAWLEKGKGKDFATPGMIAREKRKMRDLIRDGKVDSLEAELLMQDAKKTKLEGKLGMFAGRIAEKNREFKKNSWFYRNIISIPEYDKKWKTWLHRGAKTMTIGAGAGVLGAGLGAALGGAALIGGGYSLARLGASALAGAGAGAIHERATRKQVLEDKQRYKEMLDSGYSETRKKLGEKGIRLSGEEFNQLRNLRKQKELSQDDLKLRNSLEEKYREYQKIRSNQYDRSRDNYQELVMRRRAKNEKNRALWAGAAGFAVGFGSSYMIPRAEVIDIINDIDNTPVTPTPEVIIPKTETVSGDIFINKGEGITDAFLRQLQHNPELRDHLGITGEPTGKDAFVVAKQLGYIGENGEVRVNWGKGAGYELKLDNGRLISHEHYGGHIDETTGNYVGGQIKESHDTTSSYFEGRNIEDRSTPENYEYLHNTQKIEQSHTPSTVTHSEEVVPEAVYSNTSTQENITVEPLFETTGTTVNETVPYVDENPEAIYSSTETTTNDTYEHVEQQQLPYDGRGKTNAEIRRELRELYRKNEITKYEHRELKRFWLRDGKTWGGKNKGLFAGLAATLTIGADIIEDGKLDGFGIFDGNNGGGGTTIPEGGPGHNPSGGGIDNNGQTNPNTGGSGNTNTGGGPGHSGN